MIVKALNSVIIVIGGIVLICLLFMGWLAINFPVEPPPCVSKGKVAVDRIKETLTRHVQREVAGARIEAIAIHACDPFDQQKIGNWDIRNCVDANIEYEIASPNSASENAESAQNQTNQKSEKLSRESRHMLFTPCGDVLFSAYD
jgi:hypothetical protein